ncbi:MAG: phosphatase PAP2 family protein [Chlamydiia bacterium]|nr:phosphatase PAP2 family protein [Chlamydiia bacterium]
MEALHHWEMSLVYALQQWGRPGWDSFFIFLNYFDTVFFVFLLVPILWYGYHWKSGMRVFSILALNSYVNFLFKVFFHQPRPLMVDPSVGVMKATTGGFPSGAAQTVILLSGILVCSWRSWWAWCFAAVYIFFISVSRVYLGMHYPTDLVGGWAIGLGMVGIYYYVFPEIERLLKRWSFLQKAIFVAAVPVVMLIVYQSLSTYLLAMSMAGGGIGALAASYCEVIEDSRTWQQRIVRPLVAIGGIFVIYALFVSWYGPGANKSYLSGGALMMISLWTTLGASSLFYLLPARYVHTHLRHRTESK